MDRHDYVDRLLAHYEAPHHYGPLAEADVVLQGSNPDCGDVVTIYLRISEGNAQTVQFEAEGCAISQSAASILMDRVQGKPLAEIEAIDYNDLIEELGRDVVMTRVRCATLALTTLKSAIREYFTRQKLPST
jgi:nitrogen fixation NifU-like protein